MTIANRRVFDKLRFYSESHKSDNVVRYIETNESDKQALRETKFYSHPSHVFSDSTAIYFAAFDSNIYVIAKGFFNKAASDELSLTEANAGLFTAIVSELPINVASRTRDEQLTENIFFPVDETEVGPPKVSYKLEDIERFFEPFQIYSVASESLLLHDDFADRIALHFLVATKAATHIAFRGATTERFTEASITPATNYPHRLLLRAYLAHRWDQVFLDIYRCIEQLFPLSRVRRLMVGMNQKHAARVPPQTPNSLRLHELAELTESTLGWRAKEDDAISELVESLHPDLILEICCYFDIDEKHDRAAYKVAEQLYKLRNRAVHFRPIHSNEPELDSDKWECITVWLLRATCSLYEGSGRELRSNYLPLEQHFSTPV